MKKMKERNNWIWRNPLKYAIIVMTIYFIISVVLVLTLEQRYDIKKHENLVLVIFMSILCILAFDGYRRMDEYEWKCLNCDYTIDSGKRYKYCPKCGHKMNAVKKEIKIRACPYCKSILKPDMAYCPKCGKYVGDENGRQNRLQGKK